MSLLKPAALAFCLAFALPTQAREPVRFAGEEWPPFVTPSLPEHGLSSAIMQAVFAKAGRSVQIDYFPWKRTMELGLHDPRYAGFLAVWRTPEREKLCHFSAPVGNTLTVIAHLRDTLVAADSVTDLANYRVGTVAGYANDERFDTLVKQKKIAVEEGVNDETNVRKLLMRRFPVIMIERRVLQHLLSSGRFSDADRVRIAVNDTLFRERPVHLCFKRTPDGLALQRTFNEAARQVDIGKIEREYLRQMGTAGGAEP